MSNWVSFPLDSVFPFTQIQPVCPGEVLQMFRVRVINIWYVLLAVLVLS